MKAKELKEALMKLDDDEEIAVHISMTNETADCFLHFVNDCVFGRTVLEFIDGDKLIK